ncbi:proline racemase family protein [Chloroflexota bacterium]
MKLKRVLSAVDTHTAGSPERVVVSGVPPIPGSNMIEKAKYMRESMDHLRTLLVHEPRGHGNMYAALIVPPTMPDADVGVLYLEVGGYPTMCGHGTIAICTVLVETGVVEAREPTTEIALDTPAGLVRARVAVHGGEVESVTIRNVPSFLYKADVEIDAPGLGRVMVDIAYGGNFCAILPAETVGLDVVPESTADLISYGAQIWEAVNEQVVVRHPLEPGIDGVNYVQFYAPAAHPHATARNAVIAPPTSLDRSPCGTGTSARMAALYAKGELGLNEEFVHESIVGSRFSARLVEETQVGEYTAVVPTITGSAYITGFHQFMLDPRDPFPAGFLLGKQEPYGVGSDS